MIVDEAPGREELAEGRPLVGQRGKMLWGTAAEAGWGRADCFVTSINQASTSNKAKDLALERPRLEAELQSSGARILYLVGSVAFKAVTGGLVGPDGKKITGVTAMRGYLLRPSDFAPVFVRQQVQTGVYKTSRAGKYQAGDPKFAMKRLPLPRPLPPSLEWIVATLSPVTIMKQEFETLPALRADSARVGRALHGGLDLIDPDTLAFHPTPVRLEGDVVAIDIETPGKDCDDIERVGASDGEVTWSAEWNASSRAAVADLLSNPHLTIVIHNAAFDLPRLERAGVPALRGRLWDSMYAAQLLAPAMRKGLGATASVHLDLRPWKHLNVGDAKARYNAMDAYVEARLARVQMRLM
jgi:hypothetical protein